MDYNTRIDNLRKKFNVSLIINSYENNSNKEQVINYLNNSNLEEVDDDNISKRIDKISQLIYCQDWVKLNIINKRIKIIEFVDNLKTENCNIEDLKSNLLQKLSEKKIQKKHIIYDKLNGKILDILIIEKINDKYEIKI